MSPVLPYGTAGSVAADYYNNADVATFYKSCWGGSDIHIGRYDTGTESVAEASHAMTRYLLSLFELGVDDQVLDIACGYGATLREVAKRGCQASGIDISELCVAESRRLNDAAGLADRISVEVGDFHALQYPGASVDVCICQESIIHAVDRPKVFGEVFRVLRSGGVFAVSDILTSEGADLALVEAAFARLGVTDCMTLADYIQMAEQSGFRIEHAEERSHDIRVHYAKLAKLLRRLQPV